MSGYNSDNLVAGRLIEITEVSFGADRAKWEAWLAQQKAESLG